MGEKSSPFGEDFSLIKFQIGLKESRSRVSDQVSGLMTEGYKSPPWRAIFLAKAAAVSLITFIVKLEPWNPRILAPKAIGFSRYYSERHNKIVMPILH